MLDKAEYSAFESTLNSSIVSYRIIDDYLRRFCSFRLRRIVTFTLSAPDTVSVSTLTHSLTYSYLLLACLSVYSEVR